MINFFFDIDSFLDIFICFLGGQFIPPACPVLGQTGSACNTPFTLCDLLKPCQNNGTCVNNNTVLRGYTCLCLLNFNGTECQYDNQPCQPNTCLNNGI